MKKILCLFVLILNGILGHSIDENSKPTFFSLYKYLLSKKKEQEYDECLREYKVFMEVLNDINHYPTKILEDNIIKDKMIKENQIIQKIDYYV